MSHFNIEHNPKIPRPSIVMAGANPALMPIRYAVAGAVELREVFVDLDQLGHHPPKLSPEAQRLLVSGVYPASRWSAPSGTTILE